MRQALITGALGFVGRNLISELLAANYKIFAQDRSDKSFPRDTSDVTYIKTEIEKLDSNEVPLGACDVLYHLAWAGVNPDARRDLKLQMKNIELSVSAVELARRLGIPRVVFIGSTMEYCYSQGEISEKSLPTPANAYGSCKLAARFICANLAKDYGIDFEYAVITSIYGPGREDENVIFYSINELLSGRIPKLSSCAQVWDFIHIKDAAKALRLIGEYGKPHSFYAVGTGENRKLRESVKIISELINPNIPIEFAKVTESKTAHSAVDVCKLKSDTGYEPSYSFATGIAELIDYYKQRKI